MSSIFNDKPVYLIECLIFHFWKENETGNAVEFFSLWVRDGEVVRAPHGVWASLKGRSIDQVSKELKAKGYKLEIL